MQTFANTDLSNRVSKFGLKNLRMPDILYHNQYSQKVCNYIFTKAILLVKFVNISSLENYHLYGTSKSS